jgi:hypothetical protein
MQQLVGQCLGDNRLEGPTQARPTAAAAAAAAGTARRTVTPPCTTR